MGTVTIEYRKLRRADGGTKAEKNGSLSPQITQITRITNIGVERGRYWGPGGTDT
jgi:hypothetical protein